MALASEPNLLIPFFSGKGTDHQGRTLDEILDWPDELLEDCHDYIQTLFPLPEPSRFSCNSTLIDSKVFEAFRGSQDLRDALKRAFDRILSFYGLERYEDKELVKIRQSSDFEIRSRNWFKRVDHNHLRITRILRSLRVLGLEDEAEAFFVTLSSIYSHADNLRRPSSESMKYWTRAAKRRLNFAPNVNDASNPHSGEVFLWKYEMKKKRELAKAAALAEEGDSSSSSCTYYRTGDGKLMKFIAPEDDGGVPVPPYDEEEELYWRRVAYQQRVPSYTGNYDDAEATKSPLNNGQGKAKHMESDVAKGKSKNPDADASESEYEPEQLSGSGQRTALKNGNGKAKQMESVKSANASEAGDEPEQVYPGLSRRTNRRYRKGKGKQIALDLTSKSKVDESDDETEQLYNGASQRATLTHHPRTPKRKVEGGAEKAQKATKFADDSN